MPKYPSIRESKTHAKHLSRTFNLKLTEAQEIVSYMYACDDWGGLMRKENTIINPKRHFLDTSYLYLPSESELRKFDAFVSSHIEAIEKHLGKEIYVSGSLLEKVASKHYNKISGKIIKSAINEWEEYESDDKKLDSSELIDSLGHLDDTFNKVLHSKNKSQIYALNTHLEPQCYGQKLYAHYRFKKQELNIVSREWDFQIFRPTNTKNKITKEYVQSVCNRKWFINYMVGYLKLITQQFRMAGYSGNIRICKIQNASVYNFYKNQRGEYSHSGIEKLFEALLSLGGKYAWDTSSSGCKIDFGIEIPFKRESCQWMLGECSL